jgi:anhydro-N-acetylmuramic acid kinase
MDGWIFRHTGASYDRDGFWASSGKVNPTLLSRLLTHPFLAQVPPKSTGRDTFHMDWLESMVSPEYQAADVEATLLEYSAMCIANAIDSYCSAATEVYLCGGGCHNAALVSRIRNLLPSRSVALTDTLGIDADWVEAAAFAWLARQTHYAMPGNLPTATGASGDRILGAIYPA